MYAMPPAPQSLPTGNMSFSPYAIPTKYGEEANDTKTSDAFQLFLEKNNFHNDE